MPSGLDLLEGKASANIIENAPNSNLPPFDIKVPAGVEPEAMADTIAGTDVKSGLDILNTGDSKPKTITHSPTHPINVDAYDPLKIMGRIVPKLDNRPELATRRGLVQATAKDKFFDSLSPKPKQGPIRNIPEGYVEVEMPEQFISKEEEDSFVTKLVDNVGRLFTSRAEESAKAAYQVVSADYFGVDPSDISPDLVSAFKSGYGGTNLGLISQIERGTKYPNPIPEGMDTKQQLAAGLGGIVGSLPTFLPFSLAGIEGGPVGMMMAGFAGDYGLRAYYLKKLENGEVRSPREFVEVLNSVVPETLKGAVLGAATGAAGKAAAASGIGAKIGAEAGVMTTMGAALEGTLPTPQDFMINAMLFGSLHGMGKVPTVARNIKDVWAKTGRKPKDIVEDAKVDRPLKDALLNEEEIPEDVIAKAQAKVDATEKIQAELAAKLEAIKNPVEPETLVKEELKVKGKKVEDIKKGNSFLDDPFGLKDEIAIIDEEGKAEGKRQYEQYIEENRLSREKAYLAEQEKMAKDEPTKTGMDLLEPTVGEIVEETATPNEMISSPKEYIENLLKDNLGKTDEAKPNELPKEKKEKKGKAKDKKPPPPKQPITDVDLQTGTPIPEALSTENHPFRDKRVEHTNSMSKVLQERIGKVDTSPEVFTRYLINEVNRYLNGEDVPIDKVRDGLSEMAAKADNLRLNFEKIEDFDAWRNIVKDAAQWARGADRLTNKRTGMNLNMGLDPTQIPEATKKIIAGAKALANYTAKARGMKEWKPGVAAESIKEELVRSFVDRSGNIRKELLDKLGDEGYEIIQKMYLSKGASSLAAQQLKQMRSEVYNGLSKNEKRILDNLILADRMLDIGKYKTAAQFKFPEGLSPTESAAYNELFQYVEKITPEKANLLKQRAQAYFEWMKKPLKDMLDAELIDQAEYDALASHNYRRLKLVDVFDKRYQAKVGKAKRTVYDSGVESLAHGRETDVFEPSSEVMALEVFNRAYGRILNNAANKTLLDLARTQKDNPFVAVKELTTDHVPSGWDRIFVYEKGERKALYLSPEMSKEWITNSPEMSYKMSQFIRYASGSPVLRTFATGIDWGFALANLPRDIMHIWYASRVFEGGKWKPLYNPNMPVYFGQMGADIGGVFNDALLRKGEYRDYIKEGGGMEFLVHQGRLMQRGRHIDGTLDGIQNFLGYLGETSELMTRLMVRRRVIKRRSAEHGVSYAEEYKNEKTRLEATFAARDYMDFGQGGGISKALDNGLPYLNASIEGTRGMFRAFKDNPIQSTYKLSQFAALVTGLYIANQALNPDTLKALKGDIAMQGNLVIPLGDGFGFDDEKGQRRYPYIKIPLDPGQKFFKMFFEASYDKSTGQTVDVDGLTNSLSQISPVSISSLPPTISGTLGYMYNKDFWKNDDIWKKTDKPLGWPESKEEYIPGQTPQALIDVGLVTGLSPERLKYALSELVTGGSMWSWLVGQGYDLAFGDLPQSKREMHLAEVLSKTPMVKRFIGITNPYTQYASPIEQAREESMLKRWIENRGLDQRVESYLFEGGKREDVIEYIRTTAKDQTTMERLKDRFIFQEKTKSLPNRSFWLSLKGTPDTDARAKLYVQRLEASTELEKEQLMKEVGIVQDAGGVISDEFKQAVMRYRDKK